MYSDIIDGAQYVPVGEPANWNFGRYKNDDATAAFTDVCQQPPARPTAPPR